MKANSSSQNNPTPSSIAGDDIPFLSVAAPRTRATARTKREETRRRHLEHVRAMELEAAARKERVEREAEDERQFWLQNIPTMQRLASTMPDQSSRRIFSNLGCLTAIMDCLRTAPKTRDEIVMSVFHDARYSFAHIGFLLGKMCGSDPVRNLWLKGEDRRYRLHENALAPSQAGRVGI